MKEKVLPNRINEKIVGVQQVRLVGDNVTPGIYSFKEAYKIADDLNLDLVEINGEQNPIICKILDYEKYLYEQKKKNKENKQKPQEIKEIQLSPQINEHDLNLDLVEINGEQNPVICKILDYEKYLYEQKKKNKENKQKPQEIKEIQLSPQINEHDFNFKVEHAIKFLKEKNKVKAFVLFKGRSINYKDQGDTVINKFCESLSQYGKIEKSPVLEGRKLTVIINPK